MATDEEVAPGVTVAVPTHGNADVALDAVAASGGPPPSRPTGSPAGPARCRWAGWRTAPPGSADRKSVV